MTSFAEIDRILQADLSPAETGAQIFNALRAGGPLTAPPPESPEALFVTFDRACSLARARAFALVPPPPPVSLSDRLLEAVSTDKSIEALRLLLERPDPPTCDALIAASARLRFEDSRASWRLAELALVLAHECLATELAANPRPADLGQRYARRQAHQRLADAWTEVGAARRIVSDLLGAETAFEQAEIAAELGVPSPISESRRLERLALLRWDQGRLKDALRLARKVASIARDIHDPHEQGTALVLIATLLYELDRTAEAIDSLRQATALIDAQRNPRAAFAVHQNLVFYLLETPRAHEAPALLPQLRKHVAQVGGKEDLVNLVWLEGKVALATDKPWAAAEHLAQARLALTGLDRAIDYGLVTLELASAKLQLGALEEARTLASEARDVLAATGLRLEASAAELLSSATQQALVTAVRDLLAQARAHQSPKKVRP